MKKYIVIILTLLLFFNCKGQEKKIVPDYEKKFKPDYVGVVNDSIIGAIFQKEEMEMNLALDNEGTIKIIEREKWKHKQNHSKKISIDNLLSKSDYTTQDKLCEKKIKLKEFKKYLNSLSEKDLIKFLGSGKPTYNCKCISENEDIQDYILNLYQKKFAEKIKISKYKVMAIHNPKKHLNKLIEYSNNFNENSKDDAYEKVLNGLIEAKQYKVAFKFYKKLINLSLKQLRKTKGTDNHYPLIYLTHHTQK